MAGPYAGSARSYIMEGNPASAFSPTRGIVSPLLAAASVMSVLGTSPCKLFVEDMPALLDTSTLTSSCRCALLMNRAGLGFKIDLSAPSFALV